MPQVLAEVPGLAPLPWQVSHSFQDLYMGKNKKKVEAELAKIPFFVRGKVRKNTEAFARERGLAVIDSEALYEAKAHFSR